MEYHKEYSKKNGTQRNIEKFGIWNIPGIFEKKGTQSKFEKSPGIFQEIYHNDWGRKV